MLHSWMQHFDKCVRCGRSRRNALDPYDCDPEDVYRNRGSYRIELPLPPKGCSPNRISHAIAWGQSRKAYMGDVVAILRSCELPAFRRRIVISWTFYLGRGSNDREKYLRSGYYFPKDEDNAHMALKGAQDALKVSGVVIDDNASRVRVEGVKLHSTAKEHEGRACVLLVIREEQD